MVTKMRRIVYLSKPICRKCGKSSTWSVMCRRRSFLCADCVAQRQRWAAAGLCPECGSSALQQGWSGAVCRACGYDESTRIEYARQPKGLRH